MNNNNKKSEKEFLESYNLGDYERPSLAADMVLFTVISNKEDNYRKLPGKQLSVLMIKRGEHPFLNEWALPGGFVRTGETVEEAATRELFEETGVGKAHLEQLSVFSEPDRDPRGWIVSCSFMALVENSRLSIKSGNDASDAKWFDISYKLIREESEETITGYISKMYYKLILSNSDIVLSSEIEVKITASMYNKNVEYSIVKSDGIAFDHAKIISYAISNLRKKVDLTTIAFELLPEFFTLTDLQKVYEIILDKELLTANFRRKIADFVIETDNATSSAGHRPSKLHKRNIEAFIKKDEL